jgi:hypothetical protein
MIQQMANKMDRQSTQRNSHSKSWKFKNFRHIQLKKKNIEELRPYMSIFIIITFLFSIVFLKMEIRRVGYSDLKLARDEKRTRDQQRGQMIALAKVTRPDRLQKVAESRLTLRKAEVGQIIQMTDVGRTLKQ